MNYVLRFALAALAGLSLVGAVGCCSDADGLTDSKVPFVQSFENRE